MRSVAATLTQEGVKHYQAILWGGLIAGALDISAAFITSGLRGRSPLWVLQSIASGLLGRDAFEGGVPTAILGGAIHFLIAFVVASVYFGLSRKFGFLSRWPVACGLLYGVAVYLFMNLIVLRIAFSGRITYSLAVVVTGLIIHMICVGLPIAISVSKLSQ